MNKILEKAIRYAIEGKFLRKCREELDELIGRFSRWLLKIHIKTENNKVLFHTQEDRYCCNQKYICEEFRKRNIPDIDLVYVVNTKGNRKNVPTDVRVVARGSYNYFKEMFSAKYIFTNSVLYVKRGFRLKKDQVLFETWHGSLGIKRFGKNDYKSSWKWVRGAINTGKMTTYCISNSAFEDHVYKDSYWPNTPCLRYGHPRNDIMFENGQNLKDQIKQEFIAKHELAPDTKFILYAPTFRDSKNFDCYDIDVVGVLQAAKERFGGEWKILLRYHMTLQKVYKSRETLGKSDKENIINVTSYPDMQELITIADIAITDYSSWIYDFLLQRRPGFIFATDIDLYNTERGFYYPLESTPFLIATNREELNENVRKFDNEIYLEKVEAFLKDKECCEDGHASERVVDKVLELMGR